MTEPFQMGDGGVSIADEAASCTRQRVKIPKRIEHGSANSVIGECVKLDITKVVESVGGLNQPDGACRDEIVNGNTRRTSAVKTGRKHSYLRHVIEDELFTLT